MLRKLLPHNKASIFWFITLPFIAGAALFAKDSNILKPFHPAKGVQSKDTAIKGGCFMSAVVGILFGVGVLYSLYRFDRWLTN